MRILEIHHNLNGGGSQHFMVDLSNELSKTDEVHIVTVKDDRIHPEICRFYYEDLKTNVKYHNLRCRNGFSLETEWRIFQFIKKTRPDVVHLHDASMPAFCAIALFMLSHQCVFFQTIHSDLHNGYEGFFNKFILFGLLGRFRRIRFVSLSRTNYNQFTKAYPYADFTHIDNGRAPLEKTEEFDNVKREIEGFKSSNDTRIIIHVGRCDAVKNQKLLVEAFVNISRKRHDIELVIIGGKYDNSLGQELRRLANEHVHFLGIKKNISDYMFCSDLFVLSSQYEGMPITLIEASLAGLPAVSTPVSGSLDIIKNGVNGFVSKDHSLEEYQNSLEDALMHIDVLKKNACDMQTKSPYTIKECARKYRQLFLPNYKNQ